MGLLPVDSGIKYVASVNLHLLIPLLFYGQTWIMLPSMNECGWKKINGMFPTPVWPAFPCKVPSVFEALLRRFTSWAS